ncbi:MAG TPA: type IV secretion system DNA-binding domain-containing protein [Thermoanaerobaculia bacterium]|nr:type IV secretion system DNA-binding domain-containing protein [Thermoanaerobaculia bacterium]
MNRLDRFLAPTAVRRMIARESGNLSIRKVLAENAILLVNLTASQHLTNESGKLIAALLLNEFREAALERPGTKDRFFLFLDEFQEYVTHDVAAMLDQVRKGGLNLVLSHQHLGQLGADEALESSIATNARIKAVFGGLDYESAVLVANEIRLKAINRRQVERQIYRSTTLAHEVQKVEVEGGSHTDGYSASRGTSESEAGGFDAYGDPKVDHHSAGTQQTAVESSTDASTWHESAVLTPIIGKELSTEQAKTLQDKTAAEAFEIMNMKPRDLYLKLPEMPLALWQHVPEIPTRGVSDETMETYAAKAFERSDARPPSEIDEIMASSRRAFFEKATAPPVDDTGPPSGRSKSRPKPRSR